jgi:hypothetical protein
MQRLDLKFVCRQGDFVNHGMAGRKELAAPRMAVWEYFMLPRPELKMAGLR